MRYKRISAKDIKEGTPVQYAAVYILDARKLQEAGIEIDSYFVEVEE